MEPVIVVDDERWQTLLEATNGAFAPCFQCGVCTAMCPWGLVRDEPISIRALLRDAQLGLDRFEGALWLCTACYQCETQCPRGVPIVAAIRGLRYLRWQEQHAESGLPSALWSIYWNNNPLHQPPSDRMNWARDLDLPRFDAREHEILLYIGCTASYERRGQESARALIELLRAADVSFGVLGEEEPCCGEAALSFGHIPFFNDIALRATTIFRKYNVGKTVVLSPHCYEAFLEEYPHVSDEFEPIHYTTYLVELLSEGRLAVKGSPNMRVAFHDPCLLARKVDMVQTPREILASIKGLELTEFTENREKTLCCGGGGGRMWLETPSGERFAELRIEEAIQSDIHLLATACPYCLTCLEDSLRSVGELELEVRDLAEVLLEATAKPSS